MAGIETNFDFDELDKNLDGFLEEFMEIFKERVRARTPIRTGNLERSFDYDIENGAIEFGSDCDYAEHVEWGTDKQAPRLMVSTTCEEADAIARKAIRNLKLNDKA